LHRKNNNSNNIIKYEIDGNSSAAAAAFCYNNISLLSILFFFLKNVLPTPNGGMTSIGKRNGGGNGLLAKRVGVRVYTARGNKRYARRKCGW